MIETRSVLFGLTGLLSVGVAQGQVAEELAPVTVLARRIASPSPVNAASVGTISGGGLEKMQRFRLLDSLELIPGTQALSTAGLTGNTGTLIIRGLGSSYQQVLVDGVRVSDTTNQLGNFLANARSGGNTSLEVLRGPQSVLYGSGAGGGVLGLTTEVGKGAPEGTLFGEGGSFDSYQATLAARGRLGKLAYGLEVGKQFTANDTYPALSRHDYEQDFANLALEWQLRDDLKLKLSYRGADNLLETQSESAFGASSQAITTQTSLFAMNALYQVSPGWQSRLTLGYYDERYRGEFDGAFGASIFSTDFERYTFNWVNELEITESLSSVFGIENSVSDFSNSSGRRTHEVTTGAYANFYYQAVEGLQLEAGARYDEHNEFAGDAAWNLGAAYTWGRDTRFHARLSESYRNPSRLDSEAFRGAFSNQLANSDLKSEEIQGWEIGVSHDLGDHSLALTYYEQRLENAIRTEFLGGGDTQRVNGVGSSKVSGLEFAAQGQLSETVSYRFAFSSQFAEEVIDLPDQVASFDLRYEEGALLLGGGLAYTGRAAYLAPGNPQTDARTLTRLYGQYRVNKAISVHARIENLFDESYQLFPNTFGAGTEVEGPGRALFVGASISF